MCRLPPQGMVIRGRRPYFGFRRGYLKIGQRWLNYLATTKSNSTASRYHPRTMQFSCITAKPVNFRLSRSFGNANDNKVASQSSGGPLRAYDAKVNAELLRDDPHQRGE
jgi:hypothetical protein